MEPYSYSEHALGLIKMIPVAFCLGLVVAIVIAVARKFQDRNVIAKRIVEATRKTGRPPSLRRRIVLIALALVFLSIPIGYKYLFSVSQRATVVEFIRGH
jgi:hypothetical protein